MLSPPSPTVASGGGRLHPATTGKATGDRGARSHPRHRTHGEVDMGDREQLHELRQQAHDAGIEGNSKMTEEQLREALRKVGRGESPQMAKQQAKR